MRNLKIYMLLAAVWSSFGVDFASPPPAAANVAEVLSLTTAIRRMWSASPQLQAQQEQVELAKGDERRRFWPNEPQLQLARNDDGVAQVFGMTLAAGLPGKASALSRMDASKVAAQELELSAKKYDLAKTVVQAYLDCASQQRLAAMTQATIADLEAVAKTLRTLYDAGHSTQADTISAQLQLNQARADLLTAQDKGAVACQKLTSLPGLADAAASVRSFTLPDDLDAGLLAELSGHTADQARAEAQARVAHASADAAFWQQMPDITFGISRNHYVLPTASPAGDAWTTSMTAAVTLPLFYRQYEGAEERRAKAQAVIDADNAQLQQLNAAADSRDAAREYQRAVARLKEIRSRDLVLAEALVETTFSAYRSGKVGFADLVLSRRTLADLRSQEVQLLASVISSHLRCLTDC